MSRSEVLRPIILNWPRMEKDRFILLERAVIGFTDSEVVKGVQDLLRKCQYPPTVAELYAACDAYRPKQKARRQQGFRPGDVIHGQQTLTPEEAAREIERLKVEYPEAFEEPKELNMALTSPSERRERLMGGIHRIYLHALRRCVRLDASKRILVAEQRLLF